MVTKLESVEDETLVGLVEEGLGAELVTSALYPRLVEAALGAELGSDLVSQLTQAGQTPLALALQVNMRHFVSLKSTRAIFLIIRNLFEFFKQGYCIFLHVRYESILNYYEFYFSLF